MLTDITHNDFAQPLDLDLDQLLEPTDLQQQLEALEREWQLSQEVFYDEDLILYGAGINLNVDPEILSVLTIEDLF